MTCKLGGGPVWSHELIASLWSDYVRSLHIHYCREPRHCYTNTEDRPDIVVFDTQSGSIIDLDISLTLSWSSETFPNSAYTDGEAALRREEEKMEEVQFREENRRRLCENDTPCL